MPPTPPPSRSILPLLAVAVVVLGALAPLLVRELKRSEVDASMEVFFAADERSMGSFDRLEAMMTERIACLVLLHFDGIFSPEGAALIDEVGKALAALDGVPACFSLTRARRPVRAPGFSLDPRKFVVFEPFLPLSGVESPEEWAALEASVTDYPWARDLLVSRDGKWTMLVAEVERDLSTHEARVRLRTEVEEVVARFRDRVEEVHIGSFPFIEAEVREDIQENGRRFFFFLPILLAVILLITFRSWQVLFCVLAFETMGVGLVPVIFALNGASINLYTGILFPLVAGLQLTFLTHFFAALRWGQGKGFALPVAIEVALRHVLRPSAIAAVTTIIGLLSLLTCDVGLVRDFGWLGAQAVLACFAVTFLPPWLLAKFLLRGQPPRGEAALHAADQVALWLDRLSPLVTRLARRRKLVLGIAAGLVLGAVPGLWGVRTDLRAIEFLSSNSDSRRTMAAVDEHMGGMNLFELEIDCGSPKAIQSPESLAYLERVERFAASVDGVSNVYGYAQIFSMLNELWNRGAPGSRTVPQSVPLIMAMSAIVGGEDFMFEESIHDDEQRRTTVFIRTHDMPAKRYLGILEEIVAFAAAEKPDYVTVDTRSGLHSVLESDRRIVGSQVRSLLLCLVSVFATLCLLWRSLRLAAVAILVNLPPLAAVLALHGYAGIPLNSVTVMVGAVVLGIAVDNGIHLLSFWSEERDRFTDPRDCLRWVLAHKLGPIVCTTAVLVSGLSLFLLSSFPPLADFGELSILALSVALASTVLALPPLLLVAFPNGGAPPAKGTPAAAKDTPLP